jgi:hypothetical protein
MTARFAVVAVYAAEHVTLAVLAADALEADVVTGAVAEFQAVLPGRIEVSAVVVEDHLAAVDRCPAEHLDDARRSLFECAAEDQVHGVGEVAGRAVKVRVELALSVALGRAGQMRHTEQPGSAQECGGHDGPRNGASAEHLALASLICRKHIKFLPQFKPAYFQ